MCSEEGLHALFSEPRSQRSAVAPPRRGPAELPGLRSAPPAQAPPAPEPDRAAPGRWSRRRRAEAGLAVTRRGARVGRGRVRGDPPGRGPHACARSCGDPPWEQPYVDPARVYTLRTPRPGCAPRGSWCWVAGRCVSGACQRWEPPARAVVWVRPCWDYLCVTQTSGRI